MTASTLVFIDATLDDYQSLAQGVIANAAVAVLDANQDGVEQITAVLTQHKDVESVHILSHGQPGKLYLGATHLEAETLNHYARQLQHWSNHLTADADLMLYGCSVAAGDRGTQFLQQLHHLTGASVAASATRTGSAARGGDWNLEQQIGSIKAAPVLKPETMAGYTSVFEVCIPNLLFAVDRQDIRVLGINPVNGVATSASVGTLAFDTFALARQAETGRLYYVENTFNGRVAYFDPTTQQNVIVGNTGLNDVLLVKLAQAAPEVGGMIYGLSADRSNLYSIDPATGAAANLGPITGAPVDLPAGGGDIAFDPTNPNRLFVTVTSPDVAERRYDLYAIDLPTRTATYIGDTGLEDEGSGVLAFGEDGQLYAGSQGTLYQINQTTAAATRVGQFDIGTATNPRNYNDFASLPITTARVDINVTKTDGQATAIPGSEIAYTVTVTNTTPDCDLNGITVSDLLSGNVSNVSWSAAITGNGSFPTPADAGGTGNSVIASVNLGANASIVYTIRGTIDPQTAIGTRLENTVTVTVPPGIIDPDGSDNTATDVTTIVPPGEGDPPIARNNRVTTAPNAPVNINVLRNDSDPNDDPLRITDITSGTSGTVRINRNRTPNNPADDFLVYTPNNGFRGQDTFTYTINDGNGNIDTATVTVTVRGRDVGEDDCEPGINRTGTDDSNALRGDDDINRLRGLEGDDVLRGFDCPDTLDGGRDDDQLYGGTAGDTLQGRQHGDLLYGNPGRDRINGGLGRDVLYGGIGGDFLRGGRARDEMFGEGGNDRLDGNRGFDRLLGNGGDDVLFGRQRGDRVAGNPGDDRLYGGLGRDQMRGGLGDDVLIGGRGNDRLFGEEGDDRLIGQDSRDLLYGGTGDDFLHGRQQRDTVRAGAGNDQLFGGLGFDRLNGRGGDDSVNGNRGTDTLRGGGGSDRLVGRFGADRLIGGGGSDRFVYARLDDQGDRIVDFDQTRDVIVLRQIFSAPEFDSAQPFVDYVDLVQQGADTVVRINAGNNADGFVSLVTLIGVTATNVTANSFIVS